MGKGQPRKWVSDLYMEKKNAGKKGIIANYDLQTGSLISRAFLEPSN